MKRIFLILFCINLFAQHTKLPMNISEVISLENPTYTVPTGYILQTLPLGIEEDPFDGTTQPGTVGVNDGVSGGWWSLEKIILTEGHKISSSLSAGALLYDLGSLKANVKAFKVLWYDESYTIPEDTVAEIYSVYSTGINGNPDESTFRKANETEDKALIEGMVLSEGTSIKSWGVISIIEYDKNYSNNEIGVLSFVTEAGNVGVRLSSANAANHGDIGNTAVDLSYQGSASTTTGATGQSSFAVGLDSTASGTSSISGGYLTIASGDASVALGNGAQATGTFSYSIGHLSKANGDNSVALGAFNESDGQWATSMGIYTNAVGDASTSIGHQTDAKDYASLVLGQYNLLGSTVTNSSTSFSSENTALVIGNGADGNNRSDALVVKFDGTTTIAGSVTASSFIGDGSGLTSLPLVVESITEGGNTGVRLSSANAANHGDIGNTAVDLSYQGSASTTTGATGQSSFAVGLDSTASGTSSISGGYLTIASGDASVALGNGAQATGTFSYSIGHLSKANGDNSVALGAFNESDGQWATSMGIYTNAVGDASTSIGHQTDAKDYASLVLGQYNLLGSTVTNSSTSFSSENTALVIGNGADGNNRSDALVVKFDGTTTIAGDLSINSDARLKANIISLGATLSKLLKIDGKSYTMKKDESEKQKIGLLAQDIEKVFPELVSESNGIKSVNYQGLVPVLINALKEQQSEIDELKMMLKTLLERE